MMSNNMENLLVQLTDHGKDCDFLNQQKIK